MKLYAIWVHILTILHKVISNHAKNDAKVQRFVSNHLFCKSKTTRWYKYCRNHQSHTIQIFGTKLEFWQFYHFTSEVSPIFGFYMWQLWMQCNNVCTHKAENPHSEISTPRWWINDSNIYKKLEVRKQRKQINL